MRALNALNAVIGLNPLDALHTLNALDALNALHTLNALDALNALNTLDALHTLNALNTMIPEYRHLNLRCKCLNFGGNFWGCLVASGQPASV